METATPGRIAASGSALALASALLLAMPSPVRAQCMPEQCLYCGDVFSGTTVGASKDFSSYPCTVFDQTGPDVFFCFAVDGDMEVNLALEAAPQPVADLQLLLLEGECTGAACVAAAESADGDETLDFIAAGNTSYYFAVDGRLDGDDAPFTLSVECQGYGSCDLEEPIGCGETIDGNMEGVYEAENTFKLYAGAEHPKPGSERIIPFTPAETGSATVDLSAGSLANLDLVVLEGACSPARVIAAGESGFSSEAVTFDVVGGETYYLVIDGREADEGHGDGYYLSVACESPCQDDGDCASPTPVCDEATGGCVGCVVDGDCAPDALCSPGRVCEEDPDACHGPGDCGPGERCDAAAAECLADCDAAGANPCPPDHACEAATGQCLPDEPECEYATACGPGQYCDNPEGVCVDACLHPSANDCPSGLVCGDAGLCESPPAGGDDLGAPEADADAGAPVVDAGDEGPDVPGAADPGPSAPGDSEDASAPPGSGGVSGCAGGPVSGPIGALLLLALAARRRR